MHPALTEARTINARDGTTEKGVVPVAQLRRCPRTDPRKAAVGKPVSLAMRRYQQGRRDRRASHTSPPNCR
jgi:hypothetical protein